MNKALILFIVLFAAACTTSQPPVDTSSNDVSDVVPNEVQAAVVIYHVSIHDVNFDPISLSVPLGATVEWANEDDLPHTVTANDNSFDSNILLPGETFQHRFEEAGSFDYSCAFHPDMQATVIVSNASRA